MMPAGLELLEQAIGAAREELRSLQHDDLEGVEKNAAKRVEFLQLAWKAKDGCDKRLFMGRLVVMQDLQRQLREKAETLFTETRESINEGKKTRHGILEYCRTGLGRTIGPRMFRKFS